MLNNFKIAVIIPALNEEDSLPYVLKDIPAYVDRVIVVDNGSTDNTFNIAKQYNSHPVKEPVRGYGSACLKGMEQIKDEKIIVFLDADYSDHPDKLNLLIEPIIYKNYDFVVSNRFNSNLKKDAMSLPQYFGNKTAVWLIKLFWGYKYKDLGPFRAITFDALKKMNMSDKNFGWTIEMQVKAVRQNLKIAQIDLPYRNRIGKSKISKTLKGVICAGCKIIYKIFYLKIFGAI